MSNITSRRIITVVAAPVAALAVWALCRAGGITFVVSTGSGHVRASDVVVAATVAALAGWGVVRVLENRLQRSRLWWMRVGSTCFAASIAGPSWLADGVDSVALMALHLVTAVVIVVGLAATVPLQRPRRDHSTAGPEAPAPTN